MGDLREKEDRLHKEIVAVDVEGTLSAGVTWRGIADYLRRHGGGDRLRWMTIRRLPSILLFRLGIHPREQAFKENWVLGVLAQCRGMTQAEFERLAVWVVEHHLWPGVRQSVLTELRAHVANGRSVFLISGVFQPILIRLAEKAGFEAIGTELLFDENGRFSGRIDGQFNVRQQKVAKIEALVGQHGTLAAAYGDTVNDIPMLALSNDPVAVHPDARLAAYAVEQGWRVIDS